MSTPFDVVKAIRDIGQAVADPLRDAARRLLGALDEVYAREHIRLWAERRARLKVGTLPRTVTPHVRRHLARCRTCNPAGNRQPLPIDGHAYARRRRARTRRGRR